MGTNREIAEIFNTMAGILEIEDVEWKPRAYRAAARSLQALGEDVGKIYQKGGLKGLEEIPGIGEGLGKKIVQYLETGKIPDYEKLKRTLPSGVTALLAVPGLGPYRAENLYRHHIQSVGDLKRAVREHQLANIPGFGWKSEEKIAESLGLKKAHQERRSREEVLPWANKVQLALRGLTEVERVELVGSLRRKEATIGDIDLLVVADRAAPVMAAFIQLPFVEKVLQRGLKKSEVVLENGLQVDLRVFEEKCLGAALLYFTGNKQHNIQLRKVAMRKGWKLNEYGLYDKAGKRIAGETEEGVYGQLGFKFIPPERRKGQGELDSAEFRLGN
jgi:DNA polymerase (family 10)